MALYETPTTKGFAMSKKTQKSYRFRSFLLDAALVFFTGGFWLIWIFVREMRRS